jgi:Uma2 family endonuclease
MTVDEYLEFEESSPVRHEYVNGAIYEMSGASVAHARIAREIVIAVGDHLRGGQRRAEDWRPQSYSGPEAMVEFRSIGLSVPLAQIYEGTL